MRTRRTITAILSLFALLLTAGCGAKTGLDDALMTDLFPCSEFCPESTFCRPICLVDDVCVDMRPPDCDDGDWCTEDRCDDLLERCVNEVMLVDEDGDGAWAPLDCGGTDCDDLDPEIYPGAPERCNGIDDDCDTLIDEGAELLPWEREIAVAESSMTDSVGSLVFTEEEYVYGWWDYRDGDADVYLRRMSIDGEPIGDPVQVTTSAGDGYGPDLVWTGRELGVVWDDRRDSNYEIYFARFNAELQRLTGDIRVTEALDWSLYSQVIWSGREYLILWQDERSYYFQIYAQRIGPSGLAGDALQLSDTDTWFGEVAESPRAAFDGQSYHVVWLEGTLDRFDVRHSRYDELLERQGSVMLSDDLPGSASEPEIAASELGVAVVWEQELEDGWDIMVSILSPDGTVLRPAEPVNPEGVIAREPTVLWNNNGFVILYSAFDGSFGLYYSVIEPDGELSWTHRPLVVGTGDAVDSTVTLGPGEIGVGWSDTRNGDYDAYFTRLLCAGL